MRLRATERGAKNTRRLNFALSTRSAERLSRLAAKTDASSNTEVIKNALLTYEALVDWISDGASIYIRDANGNLVPVDLLIDVEARPKEPKTAA